MDRGMGVNSISGVNQRYLGVAQQKSQSALEKLSSGLRVTKASDDASGLGRSERLRSMIRSFDGAARNSRDGIQLAKTADGALGEASEVLGRMRELSVQAASGTLTDADRATLNDEFQGLSQQLDDLGARAEFGGQALLDGSTASVEVQTGPDPGDTTSVALTELSTADLAIDTESLETAAQASDALAALDNAIADVSSARGELGASISTLEAGHALLQQSSQQLSTTESRLRDADVAFETALLAQQQILAKGAASILSQSFLSSTDSSRLV